MPRPGARGSAYFLLGEYEKAAQDLEQAVRLKPDYEEARDVLAKARKDLAPAAVVEAKSTEPKATVEAAEEMAGAPNSVPEPAPVGAAVVETAAPPVARVPHHADPKSAALHNQRGRELLNHGQYQQAVDELTAAIEAQPDFALAYNARGFTYHMLRDTAHALADLDEAIRLDPAYANAYHNRGVAKNAAGDKAGSAADEAKSRELTAKK